MVLEVVEVAMHAQPLSADEYRRETVEAFDRQLRHALAGSDTSSLPSPSVAARSAARALSTRNYFDEHAGPFYDTSRARQVLGVSRQALFERVRHHKLLRATTTDGVIVYPAFQFTADSVDPRLVPVLQVLLGSGVSGWTVALWLTAASELLEGMTPVEALRSGRADLAEAVHRLAADDAARWAT